MVLSLEPDFSFTAGVSGNVCIQAGEASLLPQYVQALPVQPPSADAAEQDLRDRFLTFRLEGAAADVSQSGYIWDTAFINPTQWTSPFLPVTAVEPTLPDDEAGVPVGYWEVLLVDAQASHQNSGSLLRRPHAQQNSREYVRGSLGSLPFAPGGEALEVTSTAAVAAAQEALTGKWLRELEQAVPPKALPPGMDRGLFGVWAEPQVADHPAETKWQDHSVHGEAPAAAPPQQAGKVKLDDLFTDVWLVEDAAESSEAESAGEANGQMDGDGGQSVLARVVELPDDIDIPGAVGPGTVERGSREPEADRIDFEHLIRADVAQSDWWVAGAPAAGKPPKKKASQEHEWAVRGGVPNLQAEYEQLRPQLAFTWPFELDTFQKEAVVHLEQGHCVFVAAHTSAGKTVVAEYAFALASKHCTRAIYTSPIKTISNQKFRDFSSQFEVGLLTGDVSIKPESPCLIMTTEILRSMLYKGADIIRDIEWVIFDEVHYVNDVERGVVWEEVIIMLPAHVNLVLLSATVPNVLEFADWVGRTKRKVIYVTGTTKRPVPLEHNLYYGGAMFTICRQDLFLTEGINAAKLAYKKKNALPQTQTQKDIKAARPTGRGDGGRGRGGPPAGAARGGRGGGGRHGAHDIRREIGYQGRGGRANSNSGMKSEKAQWMELVSLLKKQLLLPVVVFCFSKKRCDLLADNLASLDLTTGSEKSEIHVFCEKSLARLKGSDRELPQILRVREMLKRGLGVHHAGLLPIVKEVVEMLFCKGVIKVLFSTETFAMGVNAPAKTVVFQSLRKHDGKSFRTLLSGEYTQMAGRAGRRGLDTVGTVVLACWEEIPDEGEIKKLLTGKATKLESQFRLTYSMILNLLRVEDLKVEDMLKRSFAEFRAQRAAPEALQALEKGQAALSALRTRPWPAGLHGTTREEVEHYLDLSRRIEALSADLQEAVMSTRGAQQALTPGRVVQLSNKRSGLAELAMICGPVPEAATGISLTATGTSSTASSKRYYVLSLHRPSPLDEQDSKPPEASTSGHPAMPEPESAFGKLSAMPLAGKGLVLRGGKHAAKVGPGPLPRKGDVGGTPFLLQEAEAGQIEAICKLKPLKCDADAVLDPDDRAALAAAVRQLQRIAEEAAVKGEDPAQMEPQQDLKISQYDIVNALRQRQQLIQARAALACHREPALPEMYAIVRSEALLADRLRRLAHQLSDANLQQMPEFQQRVAVLQQLGYVADDKTVQLKGRVACEINSGDELVATELIFAGVLSELSPEEAVAILSALVFQEKSEVEAAAPTPGLADARDQVVALAVQAGQVQKECGLDILPEEFCRSVLRFGLVEVVYQWAKGTPFAEICELTDVMEGSIVRTMVRLDETCREFRDAARVMGNTQLFQQMEAASAAIKRDVIFAASLYVA
ncbi:hypothetical protein WJX72_008182 [[Myrmecia] bisecta]|uniref:Antiviral helicase SKI2 n=1 Tax=[Myrmecia] bisecta TaxID=41462 RepID=A0AAW1P6D4_9CHLO